MRLSIEGDAGGDWYAVKTSNGWVLAGEVAGTPDATVRIDQENAWRLFTKGITKDDAMRKAHLEGNMTLADKVLDMVSIIA